MKNDYPYVMDTEKYRVIIRFKGRYYCLASFHDLGFARCFVRGYRDAGVNDFVGIYDLEGNYYETL